MRLSQPVLSLACLVVLWRLRLLTLTAACWSWPSPCSSSSAGPTTAAGRPAWRPDGLETRLVRPLAAYGIAQIAALTPATVNARLDQLVLSQAVPAATLGRYAIAVSCTMLPLPVVAAIGNVAFPRLASRRHIDGLDVPAAVAEHRRQRLPRGGCPGAAGPGRPLAHPPRVRDRLRGGGTAAVAAHSGRGVPGLQPGHRGHPAGQEAPAGRGPGGGPGGRVHGGPAGGPASPGRRLRRGDSVRGGLRRRARHDAAVPATAAAGRLRPGAERRHGQAEKTQPRRRRDDHRPQGGGDRHRPHLPGRGTARRRPAPRGTSSRAPASTTRTT